MRIAFLLTCIVFVIDGAFCQAGAPLPGQIIIDPDYPQWLKRHGGKHVDSAPRFLKSKVLPSFLCMEKLAECE